jgi:ferritin-like metal-binding protein YciE
MTMISAQLKELVLQSITHERGGVLVYQTALECTVNDDLRDAWMKYLSQTQRHVAILTDVCESLGLDAGEMTPGCRIVQHTGKALVEAMEMALAEGDAAAAERVACECVVLAETKDHADWELLGECAQALGGEAASVLTEAAEQVEKEEDEHLYQSQGWCRELWLKSLGLKAVLPPPEKTKGVKSAAGAEKAKKARQAQAAP